MISLAGCIGVPQSEFEALQAEYEALQAEHATLGNENTSLKAELQTVQSDLTNLQADYEAINVDYDTLNADYEAIDEELAEIKEVYPPRDFPSMRELEDWLRANDVSDEPPATFAEGVYSKALRIQEDALNDGYIVSAWIDYYPETQEFYINCTAVADGYVWMWDPETDELINFSDASGLLKLE
jgi:chaperonin cofactor prefoldin